MAKYIDADRLREKIIDRLDLFKELSSDTISPIRIDECKQIIDIIDSFQPEPNAYEDAMLEVKEYVDKLYDNASIGLNEYDSGLYNGIAETCMKLRGFIKARTSREQPDVDLEKEIKDWCDKNITGVQPIYTGDSLIHNLLPRTARHFYELGQRRAAEMYDEVEYNRQRATGVISFEYRIIGRNTIENLDMNELENAGIGWGDEVIVQIKKKEESK